MKNKIKKSVQLTFSVMDNPGTVTIHPRFLRSFLSDQIQIDDAIEQLKKVHTLDILQTIVEWSPPDPNRPGAQKGLPPKEIYRWGKLAAKFEDHDRKKKGITLTRIEANMIWSRLTNKDFEHPVQRPFFEFLAMFLKAADLEDEWDLIEDDDEEEASELPAE